jgi:hypothetical protein
MVILFISFNYSIPIINIILFSFLFGIHFYIFYIEKSLKISFKYKKYLKIFKKKFLYYINMENTNTIINNKEDEKKQKYLEARRRAARAFHERNKDNEVYKQKQRDNSKRVYQNDKERIIARVRANQRRNQEIEQLERLHELKQQGLITFEKLNLKDSHELLNNLEILGM